MTTKKTNSSDSEMIRDPSKNPRVKLISRSLAEWIDLKTAIELLAVYMVANEEADEREQELYAIGIRLGLMAKTTALEAVTTCDVALAAVNRGKNVTIQLLAKKLKATERAQKAANIRHDRPGNTREKRQKILSIWNSGKYANRDLCAEQECAALDMAFGTARKALRNTPNPLRRCAA